ncbi:ead/Ea22-like family protein [Citrobacter freundii]|nr:ead/Ea22-like family protein [Citrobacter freundii]
MTALNKQALIAKIKKQTESFDTVVLKEGEANMLLGELESQQIFQQAFFRQSLMYDVVAEAYEEAKEQIAKDVEIKARLCRESNSLFDRLRAAEKRIAETSQRNSELVAKIEPMDRRIAELSASHSKLRDTMATIHNTIRMDGGYTPLAAILNATKRAHEESAIAAGIGVKGE